MAKVTELNAPKLPETGGIPAEFQDETEPGAAANARKVAGKRGRPFKGAAPPPEQRNPRFFERVANVAKEDWGSRAFMYVYVTEPCCNPKTFGESRYLLKSSTPILDLEGLKQDYGSFKGWMSLNIRKTGKDATDETDRLEFEIYDPKHPPKIPRASWANDKRNARWEALLPPEAPAQNAGAAPFLDSIKVYKEIVNDLRNEREDDPEPVDSTRQTLETMKLAKDLFAPATVAPAPAADPFDTAKKIMEMRGNDPMVAALMQRLEASDKAAEKAREREFELMKELRTNANGAAPKGMIEQLTELAALGDKLKPLKEMFGFGGAEAAVGRAVRTTAFDVIREVASSPFGAALGSGLGSMLSNIANRATAPPPQQTNGAPQVQQPTVLNAQQPNGTVPPTETMDQCLQRIGEAITRPMLYNYFLKDLNGEDFAEFMFDAWPEDYVFTRGIGPDELMRRYKQFPAAWAIIQAREADFGEFLKEFCGWNPNEDEGPAPGTKEDDGVVDLEAS